MKRILSTIEILGLFTREDQEFEVCASAEANFDETRSELRLDLDSFIRPVDIRSKEKHLPAGWLPKRESLHESVSQEDAVSLAKEIFRRWVGKVRQSVPSPIHNY